MSYSPHQSIGYALDSDEDSDLIEFDVDLADNSDSTVLLNGMKILFEKAVSVSPVNLLPKTSRSRDRT